MYNINPESFENNENFLRMLSDEYFKFSPNYYFCDESALLMEKDFGSLFKKNSFPNSPQLEDNYMKDNFGEINATNDYLKFNQIEQNLPPDMDSFSILIHVKVLFFNKEFEEILKFISGNFYNIFVCFPEIKYIVQKMIFFDILINQKNKEGAERYLENNLRKALLDLNKNEWKSKEKYFKQTIKNPENLHWKKILDLNFKRLVNFLKKYFGILNYEDNDFPHHVLLNNIFHLDENFKNDLSRKGSNFSANSHQNEIKLRSSSSPNLLVPHVAMEDYTNMCGLRDENNTNANRFEILNEINPAEICNQEYEIKNLSEYSTMEEFSDLDEQTGINIATSNNIDFSNNIINPIEFQIPENELETTSKKNNNLKAASFNNENNIKINNLNLNNFPFTKKIEFSKTYLDDNQQTTNKFQKNDNFEDDYNMTNSNFEEIFMYADLESTKENSKKKKDAERIQKFIDMTKRYNSKPLLKKDQFFEEDNNFNLKKNETIKKLEKFIDSKTNVFSNFFSKTEKIFFKNDIFNTALESNNENMNGIYKKEENAPSLPIIPINSNNNLNHPTEVTEIVDTRIFNIERQDHIRDRNSTLNLLTKENFPISKKKLKLSEIIPNLNQIKIKFTKRENIDKKILKLFKNYIKEKIKKKKKENIDEMKNMSFWNRFIQGIYTPPFQIQDDVTNESLEFKSMNSFYIIWIFQNEFSNELYKMFLKEKGNSVYESLVDFFEVKEGEDSKTLKFYIYNFDKIFSFEANQDHLELPGENKQKEKGIHNPENKENFNNNNFDPAISCSYVSDTYNYKSVETNDDFDCAPNVAADPFYMKKNKKKDNHDRSRDLEKSYEFDD